MFTRHGRIDGSNAETEAELLRALGRGSSAAMATIYQRHGGLIYRFSYRMCQDQSIAEEVTQEVFLTLLKQADRFDPNRAALSTWLCGIAKKLVWKQMEQRQRYVTIEMSGDSFEMESSEEIPDALLSQKEMVQAVQRGIDELPVDFKAVIVLCELEEVKYDDAALILSIPVGTVRSRLSRAKRRLAALLDNSLVANRKDGRLL